MGLSWKDVLWSQVFGLWTLLMPESEIENQKAATLDEFDFPTATEGRVIPLGWGTYRVEGPNVLWYGDYSTRPIVEKIKTGVFSKKKVVTGHLYYVGIQLGLCIGPVALRKIWIDDEVVWEGNQTTDGDIEISSPETGVYGTFSFYTGSKTQSVDSYLPNFQYPCSAYRGESYGVFHDSTGSKGGRVGDSTSIKPWSFEVTRIPTGLGSTYPTVNSYDCNPMELVYELLTSSESFGYGYPASNVNISEFQDAADTLYSEGNGMSYLLQSSKNLPDILDDVESQIDGKFRFDMETGQWRVLLIRDGYSLAGLKEANNNTIKEIEDFSHGTWDETVNNIRITYDRRANDYNTSYAPAKDQANMVIQGRIISATWTFAGVKADTLANRIAWRELRSNSYPLAKGRFKLDRTFWDAYPGEVFLLTYTIDGIDFEDFPMRITKISTGNKENPDIVVDAVQDVYSWKAASSADPDPTSWTAPDKTLIPFLSDKQIAVEAPYAISRRADFPSEGRVFVSGASQGRAEAGFYIRQRNGSPPSGDYYDAGTSSSLMYVGELDGAIDNDDGTIDIITSMDVSEIFDATEFDIGNNLVNLVLIDDEFIACTGATAIAGGVRLTGCYRGLLDSAQTLHADEASVYFISIGGELTETSFALTNTVQLKLLPFNLSDDYVSESDPGLTVLSVTMSSRERKPYPPTFMVLNSTQYPTGTVSLDVQQGANEDTKGIAVEFNRRDFRIYDEVSQYDTDASAINGDFPSNNTTEYALEVWDDPDGSPSLLYTTGWQSTATDYAYRSTILRYTDGDIPSKLRVKIKTRHVYETVTYEATQTLDWDFDTASSELSGDHNFGVLEDTDVSASWTAPDTGTYSCTIGHANSGGDIEGRINGGSWGTIISSGNTSGNLAGVTAGDTIEIRSNGLTLSGVDETIFRMDSPSSAEDAYAIFVP